MIFYSVQPRIILRVSDTPANERYQIVALFPTSCRRTSHGGIKTTRGNEYNPPDVLFIEEPQRTTDYQ